MKMFCSAGRDSCEVGPTKCPAIATLSTTEYSVLNRLHKRNGIVSDSKALGDLNRKDSGAKVLFTSSNNYRNRITNNSYNDSVKCCAVENFNNCYNNNHFDTISNHSLERTSNNHPFQESTKEDLNKEELSPRLKELLEGLNKPGDSTNPPEQPGWLDRELFDRGRMFYQKYLFCIFFSDLLSILMVLSQTRILRPLIYTDKSNTPTRALRRYVSTILHIITWFSGDIWDPNDKAHKDILSVRNIHNKSASIFNSSENYDKVQSVDVREKGHIEPECPFNSLIRQDLEKQASQGLILESPQNPPLYVSQWDMAMTQYGFLGLILVHPKLMGAWGASEEDLEGFVHFWRGIGWLLGIEDKYNFCTGTAAETKALCEEVEKIVIIPSFSRSDWNHEHMSFSLMEGINMMVPGLSYPAMFRMLTDTLGLSMPRFIGKMSLKHSFQYWVMRFFLHFAFLIPGVLYIFNILLKHSLGVVQENNPGWFPKSRRMDFSNT